MIQILNPGLVVDGKVNWEMFEQLLIDNPKTPISDLLSAYEARTIYAMENTHEYYMHLGNALNKRRK